MVIVSIKGSIHRLRLNQQYKDDELQATAIYIIESSKDGLDSLIRLLNPKNSKLNFYYNLMILLIS